MGLKIKFTFFVKEYEKDKVLVWGWYCWEILFKDHRFQLEFKILSCQFHISYFICLILELKVLKFVFVNVVQKLARFQNVELV